MTVATLPTPRRPLDAATSLGILDVWRARAELIPAGTEFTSILPPDREEASWDEYQRNETPLERGMGFAKGHAELVKSGLASAPPTRGTPSMLSSRRRYIREYLLERDGNRCILCGGTFKSKGGRRASIEHLIPVSGGGTDHIDNLALAHVSCNTAKGDLLAA
jgi:HNH endonuclease